MKNVIKRFSGQTGLKDRDIFVVMIGERFWEILPKRVKAPYLK